MTVTIERDDAVAILRYGDAQSRSRWSHQSETDYFDALAELEADPAVRVIVVTGASSDFCAGPELSALSSDAARDVRGDDFPRTIAKPIIAAIDGACVGIGLSMALMCDVRVISPSATVMAGLASTGLVAEHGLAWLIQRLCGDSVAADLLLTDRRLDGVEAHRVGLAQRLASGESALGDAVELARQMSSRLSPLSLGVIKHQLNRESGGDLHQAVTRGEEMVQRIVRHPDFETAIAAFQDRQRPIFAPFDPKAFDDVVGAGDSQR